MKRTPQQVGLALPTVMLLLSLVALGCLSAWRNLWVAEQRLNLEADQLRGLHRAEAALPLAVADILGPVTPEGQAADTRHTANGNTAFFPSSTSELTTLQQRLASACEQGICAPTTTVSNAHSASHWWALRDQAMYVEGQLPDGSSAWYWVEVLADPAQDPPFIYRITVAVSGVLTGGQTVLQTVWTRTGRTRAGTWRSSAVLHD
jgi:Tfp pilus assembly protein PilX